MKMIFGRVFEAFPHGREGLGHVLFGQASSAQLGFRFPILSTSTCLGLLKGVGTSYLWPQQKMKGKDLKMLMMLALGDLLGA